MSRRHPTYIYASDEEPTEVSYHSGSSTGSSTTPMPPIEISDDSSDAYAFPPPIAPVVTPTTPIASGTHYHIGESSRRPILRQTARMSVRDLPRGPLAPRDPAPVAEEREIRCDEQSQRRVPRPAHLEWMTPMLAHWRSLEGLPSTYEIGESSQTPAPLRTTGESIELTIPTLVSVMRTMFRITSGRGYLLFGVLGDVARLETDTAHLRDTCQFLMGDVLVAREIAETARTRVRALEGRVRAAGLAVGACVVMAVLRAAVGWFLPYFQ